DAIDRRDAVKLAGLFIVHAVGIAPEGVIERDMILVLADALLAAILGKGVFGIELAPVAVAADQAGAAQAVGCNVQLDLALGEIGVAGLVIDPGDARRMQMLDLLGLDHTILDGRFELGVLG